MTTNHEAIDDLVELFRQAFDASRMWRKANSILYRLADGCGSARITPRSEEEGAQPPSVVIDMPWNRQPGTTVVGVCLVFLNHYPSRIVLHNDVALHEGKPYETDLTGQTPEAIVARVMQLIEQWSREGRFKRCASREPYHQHSLEDDGR